MLRVQVYLQVRIRNYYFLSIRKIVTRIIGEYEEYIRNKLAQHVLYRELKNLDILGQVQNLVSIDFIVKLLKSKELIIKVIYDSILVIVDRLTKFTYFMPYQEKLTVEDLAYVVKKVLLGNYQMPREFILDYNNMFHRRVHHLGECASPPTRRV